MENFSAKIFRVKKDFIRRALRILEETVSKIPKARKRLRAANACQQKNPNAIQRCRHCGTSLARQPKEVVKSDFACKTTLTKTKNLLEKRASTYMYKMNLTFIFYEIIEGSITNCFNKAEISIELPHRKAVRKMKTNVYKSR